MMRLADFILANRQQILDEWDQFAESCTPAAAPMDSGALRDHASEMLTVIAADLRTPQDGQTQADKALGMHDATDAGAPTAAEEHGAGRAESGFTMEQMVAEYRALRASVTRLWTRAEGVLNTEHIDDLIRFNEAIDQSLAESVLRFTEDLDSSKEMFLAILGHDLRTPIGAVVTASRFMLDLGELQEPHLTLTERISSSSQRMVHMVGDLLDFTRSRLGGGIPILPAPMNMGKAVHDVVDEITIAFPEAVIEVDARGELDGEWDCARISQALHNLIGNAVEHGLPRSRVGVTVFEEDDRIAIVVHNWGAAIPPEQLNGIFNPMKPRESASTAGNGPSGSLGLGLYIAERIVNAHQGTLGVVSSDADGTTFTMRLPRA